MKSHRLSACRIFAANSITHFKETVKEFSLRLQKFFCVLYYTIEFYTFGERFTDMLHRLKDILADFFRQADLVLPEFASWGEMSGAKSKPFDV